MDETTGIFRVTVTGDVVLMKKSLNGEWNGPVANNNIEGRTADK